MSNDANTPAAGQPAAAVQPATAAAAAAPAAGVVDQAAVQKAERERVSGILNCEEAAGRTKLANHLALNTSTSVDDAKATLAASGKDTTASAAAGGTGTFEQAMNNIAHPQVGADGAAGVAAGADGKPDHAAAIMRDYETASGVKLADKA